MASRVQQESDTNDSLQLASRSNSNTYGALGKLPADVRAMIFSHLLQDKVFAIKSQTSVYVLHSASPILQLSKDLRQEVIDNLHFNATVVVGSPEQLKEAFEKPIVFHHPESTPRSCVPRRVHITWFLALEDLIKSRFSADFRNYPNLQRYLETEDKAIFQNWILEWRHGLKFMPKQLRNVTFDLTDARCNFRDDYHDLPGFRQPLVAVVKEVQLGLKFRSRGQATVTICNTAPRFYNKNSGLPGQDQNQDVDKRDRSPIYGRGYFPYCRIITKPVRLPGGPATT